MRILFYSDTPDGVDLDKYTADHYKRISSKIDMTQTHDPLKLLESYAYDLVLIDYGGMCGGYGDNPELSRVFRLAVNAVEDNPNTKFTIVSYVYGDWLQNELAEHGFTDILMGHAETEAYIKEELRII